MLTLNMLVNMLQRIVKECRYKFGETYLEGIKEHKSKFVVFMNIGGRRVKVIVNKNDVKVRVFSGLTGMDISLRRIFAREYEKELRLKKLGEKSL
ncbi:MAG: hypothetical protein ABWW65_05610 [Thermoprotei archaeon]